MARTLRLPAALALLTVLAALGGEGMALALRYERAAILGGEPWRLLTGHFLHLGWAHLALNLSGLLVLGLLFGGCAGERAWLAALLVSAAASGAGLLLFNPEVAWYVGLSGVLHGLFVFGALCQGRCGRREGHAVLALMAAKLLWEQAFGPLPGSEAAAGGPVLVDAHLYGALGGLLCGVLAGRGGSRGA